MQIRLVLDVANPNRLLAHNNKLDLPTHLTVERHVVTRSLERIALFFTDSARRNHKINQVAVVVTVKRLCFFERRAGGVSAGVLGEDLIDFSLGNFLAREVKLVYTHAIGTNSDQILGELVLDVF